MSERNYLCVDLQYISLDSMESVRDS